MVTLATTYAGKAAESSGNLPMTGSDLLILGAVGVATVALAFALRALVGARR